MIQQATYLVSLSRNWMEALDFFHSSCGEPSEVHIQTVTKNIAWSVSQSYRVSSPFGVCISSDT